MTLFFDCHESVLMFFFDLWGLLLIVIIVTRCFNSHCHESWRVLIIIVSNEYTLQGTNISRKNGILKMIFLFPRWDMLVPWRVILTVMTPYYHRFKFKYFRMGIIDVPPTNLCMISWWLKAKNSGTINWPPYIPYLIRPYCREGGKRVGIDEVPLDFMMMGTLIIVTLYFFVAGINREKPSVCHPRERKKQFASRLTTRELFVVVFFPADNDKVVRGH